MVIRTAKNMEMKHYGQKYCEEEEEGIELVTSSILFALRPLGTISFGQGNVVRVHSDMNLVTDIMLYEQCKVLPPAHAGPERTGFGMRIGGVPCFRYARS